jgi:hypothetical protein
MSACHRPMGPAPHPGQGAAEQRVGQERVSAQWLLPHAQKKASVGYCLAFWITSKSQPT